MNKRFLKFLILNSTFLILLATACSRKKEPPPPPPPPIDDFVLKNLASEFPSEIRTADYAGQVQLVLFFRSDDDACRGAIADWNALQKEFAGRGFTVVGVLVDDRPDDPLAAEVAALAPAFPVGLADEPVGRAFGGPAAIRAIPSAFLLSRDGELLRAYAGFEPLDRLRDDLARALDGQPLVDRNPKPAAPEDNDP